MSPKEKAQEFIDKFTFEIGNYNAKQCALIAVDEILSLFITDCEDTRYWKQVKQEIEKL